MFFCEIRKDKKLCEIAKISTPQFHIATTVHRDYLHFARNMYAKKIVSEHVVALLVMSSKIHYLRVRSAFNRR